MIMPTGKLAQLTKEYSCPKCGNDKFEVLAEYSYGKAIYKIKCSACGFCSSENSELSEAFREWKRKSESEKIVEATDFRRGDMEGILFKVCESDSAFDIAERLIGCAEDKTVKSLSVGFLHELAGYLTIYVDARDGNGKTD